MPETEQSRYHFCDYCEPCPCCDGGDRRWPRRWRLEIRGDGELRAQCSVCHGGCYVCTAPATEQATEQPE